MRPSVESVVFWLAVFVLGAAIHFTSEPRTTEGDRESPSVFSSWGFSNFALHAFPSVSHIQSVRGSSMTYDTRRELLSLRETEWTVGYGESQTGSPDPSQSVGDFRSFSKNAGLFSTHSILRVEAEKTTIRLQAAPDSTWAIRAESLSLRPAKFLFLRTTLAFDLQAATIHVHRTEGGPVEFEADTASLQARKKEILFAGAVKASCNGRRWNAGRVLWTLDDSQLTAQTVWTETGPDGRTVRHRPGTIPKALNPFPPGNADRNP